MECTLGLLMSCLGVLAVPPDDVTATDLAGRSVQGELRSLSSESLTIVTSEGEESIRLERLLDIRWPSAERAPAKNGQVYLTDGSLLSFDAVTTAARKLRMKSSTYQQLEVPLGLVRAIRFMTPSEAAGAWERLLGRSRSKDVLVLPKKGRPSELDPTTGVVGQITDTNLHFVLGGDELPIGRNRIFGVVYARKPVASPGGYVVEIGGHDRVVARELRTAGGALEVTLHDGTVASVPLDRVQRIDLSGGKVKYLDEMKPVFHEFTSVLPDKLYEQVFHYRVNETMDGEPLRLGGRTYKRGLWIHSKTTLRYSLGGEFTRFEAVTGIDDEIPRRDKTHARLTVRADDKVVFDKEIWITDAPRQLKCDVTDAQVLEIVVDFGEKRADGTPPLHAALQDWVDLADAKVLK